MQYRLIERIMLKLVIVGKNIDYSIKQVVREAEFFERITSGR